MNDMFARRLARGDMVAAAIRSHPVLWQATQVTKEPLDYQFFREELMRVNGVRQMPLVVHEVVQQRVQYTHWNSLLASNSWAESARAFTVRNQSILTQRYASMARMGTSVQTLRAHSSIQNLFLEHVARVEGISQPMTKEE